MLRWCGLQNRSGLSVLEVLLAILILAWALAMNARMAETTVVSDQYARWSQAASQIAAAKVEQLRRAGYEQLARSPDEETMVRDGTRFRVKASVQQTSDVPGVAELEIAVEWEKGTRIKGGQTYYTLLRQQ